MFMKCKQSGTSYDLWHRRFEPRIGIQSATELNLPTIHGVFWARGIPNVMLTVNKWLGTFYDLWLRRFEHRIGIRSAADLDLSTIRAVFCARGAPNVTLTVYKQLDIFNSLWFRRFEHRIGIRSNINGHRILRYLFCPQKRRELQRKMPQGHKKGKYVFNETYKRRE